jgi:hypothetical protein
VEQAGKGRAGPAVETIRLENCSFKILLTAGRRTDTSYFFITLVVDAKNDPVKVSGIRIGLSSDQQPGPGKYVLLGTRSAALSYGSLDPPDPVTGGPSGKGREIELRGGDSSSWVYEFYGQGIRHLTARIAVTVEAEIDAGGGGGAGSGKTEAIKKTFLFKKYTVFAPLS